MSDDADATGASGQPLLAVSLHDVAPQTWPACARLLECIDAIAALRVTLLVVPDYHHGGLAAFDRGYRAALERRLARGDELALHGWTHVDEMPLAGGPLDRLRRTRLTDREGEFAALPFDMARERLQAGRDWFESNGWPLHGFVAPAWLLGQQAWWAVVAFPFRYTTTRTRMCLLPHGEKVATTTLVYSSRSRWRRRMSTWWNSAQWALRPHGRRIVRIALHPGDAAHAPIIDHFTMLLRMLLSTHEAVTKAEIAQRYAEDLPHAAGIARAGVTSAHG